MRSRTDYIEITPQSRKKKPGVIEAKPQVQVPRHSDTVRTTYKKSNTERIIDSIIDMIRLTDAEAPNKSYNWVSLAFSTSNTSQRTELFKKLSQFCKKNYKMLESLVKDKGEIRGEEFKGYKIYIEDQTLEDSAKDTIFIEFDDDVSYIDIEKSGITYANGTIITGIHNVFVPDEKVLAGYLKVIKGILLHFSKESRDALDALYELQRIVKPFLSFPTKTKETKEEK